VIWVIFLGLKFVISLMVLFILLSPSMFRDMLSKTNMLEANPIFSPMVGDCKLTNDSYVPLPDASYYRYIVGSLQYATFI